MEIGLWTAPEGFKGLATGKRVSGNEYGGTHRGRWVPLSILLKIIL